MIAKSNFNSFASIFRFIMLFVVFIINDNAFSQTYGLKFQSHDVVLDKRTELNLSPDQFLNFRDEFEISFDYRIDLLKPNDYSGLFGYIFRVISVENNNIDLIITPTPTINLNLVIGKKNSIIQVGSPNKALDSWVNLRIKFLLREDRLIFYTPDSFYVQENIGLKNNDSFKIIFGANDFENFKTSDVPSMSIKEIRISEKGKLEYHWPLDEVKGNIAGNSLSKKVANVKNPSWLKNNHQAWEPKYQHEIEGIILIASDTENGRLFLVGNKELSVYSAQEGNMLTIKYRNKPHFLTTDFKAIYNSLDNKIYCYEIDGERLYSLDILTGEWYEIGISTQSETKSRHHNSYFNAAENSIYLFGGYGQHTYNNDIRKIDLTKNTWQTLPTNKNIFPPRYLAGLGSLNDTLYLLGGYGSLSGSQMVNPQSYFDLLGYSIKDQSLFKKFEIPRLIDDMCVVNNMWIDKKNRDFYALVFEKMKFEGTLQLIKGNIDNPKVDMVGNTIPFKFQDIKSNAGLFYFAFQNKLYAYTSFAKDSSSTQLGIYSINYPPNKSDSNPPNVKTRMSLLYIYFAIAIVILSGFLTWFIIRKRSAKRKSSEVVIINEWTDDKEFEESVSILQNEKPKYQLVLFGGFQVFNMNKEDITNKFSPLIKELFLLILLFTHKNNKGISSEKITEYLWFDKSELSARNNRAVNIAKLKTILTEIGEIELTKKTGYWKIIYSNKDVKCDYAEFLQITSSKSNLTKQNVSRLVEITQKGAFLLNVNYEWLDDFKADVSDKIVDTLVAFAEKCDLKADAEFIVHLADCIFNFDRSNEEAMVLKCKAEYCLGKHSLAKLTYEKFIREYQLLYSEEYKRSFNELIKC
jgi:DNA-binding SARP family transcriptional activator